MKQNEEKAPKVRVDLKYPILLVHGMGFRDSTVFDYWGRIPKTLTAMGCRIFYGEQDCNAEIAENGQVLARRIDAVLEETGAQKVNIIAHSKGGLDSRYAISTLHCGGKVASLTTISTPHNGSKTVDLLLKLPNPLIRFAGFCTDRWVRILGDKNPSSYKVFHSLTTQAAAAFNRDNPDDPGVYYQSYAFVMRNPFSDIGMWFPNFVVGLIEGENDGLLAPAAVEWGDFKGVRRGVSRRGISHSDEVDLRRRRFSRKTGDGVSDILDVYREIVCDLNERGF